MSPSLTFALEAVQFALIIGGLLLLWRLGFSANGRRAPVALPAWTVSLSDFFLLIWLYRGEHPGKSGPGVVPENAR